MAKVILILMAIFCFNAFANTNGGGVLNMAPSPAMAAGAAGGYVRYLGVDRGEIHFQLGRFNDRREFEVEPVQKRLEEMGSERESLVQSLKDSLEKNQWIPVPRN